MFSKNQRGFTLFEAIFLPVVIFGVVGWILNIVALAGANFNDITGLLVLRVIGVFMAPLGSILGLFF